MLARSSLLAALGLVLSLGASGCAAGAMDDVSDEQPATEADALSAFPFVRSDQVSFGRAPINTHDASGMVNDDFSNPVHSADQIIAWLGQHKGYAHPLYLGCI